MTVNVTRCGICHAVTDVDTGDGDGNPGEVQAHAEWHERQGDTQAKALGDLARRQFPFGRATGD